MRESSRSIAGRDDRDEHAIDIRDYWNLAKRRRWWLTIPFLMCGITAFVVAQLWPTRYQSEAMIMVEQQKVPEQYVTPNVLADLQYRLDAMRQEILSRTRLQRVIEQFRLYARERERMTTDDVIEYMRNHIRVELVQSSGKRGDPTAFRIYFTYENPMTAQRVTNELTSLFIEYNLRSRTQQAVNTTQFLEAQLEQARKALAEQEKRLREFKLQYLGELPQQEQGNLHVLNSLQAQLQMSAAALDRAEQQRVYLESLRSEFVNMKRVLTVRPAAPEAANPVVQRIEMRLRDQQQLYSALRIKYADSHPDLRTLKQEIAETESLRQRLEADLKKAASEASAAADSTAASEPTRAAHDQALAEVESRLKALNVEIARDKEEGENLRARIQEVQRRLAITPVREQQLAEVTRNYDNSRAYYQSLLEKKLGSELATNLEKRQQGEQFRVLDPASLPQKPSEPNRLVIVLCGWAIGGLAAVGVTVAREMTDSAVHAESQLGPLDWPIVVRVPVVRSEARKTRTVLVKAAEAVWLATVVFASVGSTAYTFFLAP